LWPLALGLAPSLATQPGPPPAGLVDTAHGAACARNRAARAGRAFPVDRRRRAPRGSRGRRRYGGGRWLAGARAGRRAHPPRSRAARRPVRRVGAAQAPRGSRRRGRPADPRPRGRGPHPGLGPRRGGPAPGALGGAVAGHAGPFLPGLGPPRHRGGTGPGGRGGSRCRSRGGAGRHASPPDRRPHLAPRRPPGPP
jgi:hypothetical protein